MNNTLNSIKQSSPWYELISNYYGDKRANRSGVLLINHIDEGLFILEMINASAQAMEAYCFHPMIQSDESLYEFFTNQQISLKILDPTIVLLAMEYRSVANEYLSKRNITSIDEIRLSPLQDVNDMLIADKIQNRKDFEQYHKNSHKRTKELDEYFRLWLRKLNITEEYYNMLIEKIRSFDHAKI